MKIVFIRTDKSDITVQQKLPTEETWELYKEINSRMNPRDMKYQNLQKDVVEKISANFLDSQILSFNDLSKHKDTWNIINGARKNRRTKTMMSCLKKSFRENITDRK